MRNKKNTKVPEKKEKKNGKKTQTNPRFFFECHDDQGLGSAERPT